MSNEIRGAEVFSAGTWNGMKFAEADLDAIVSSFAALKSAARVPLKFGHNDDQPLTDGQPALGWVSRIWRSGAKLLADFTDVPTVVFEAIRKGLYKQVSIELLKDYSREGASFPWVLDAVALLGADIPAVKGLRDLQTLMMASRLAGVRVGKAAAFTLDTTIGARAIMTDDEIKALKDRVTAAENRAAAAEEANKKAEKERFTEKVAAHRKSVTDLLNAAVDEGRIYPRTRDRIVNARLFKDDAEVLTAYSIDSVKEELKTEQRADFKEKKSGNPTSRAGSGDEPDFTGKPVADVVTFRAEAECVRLGHKATDSDAMLSATARVLRADKALATAYFEDQNQPYKPADVA